MRLISVIIPVYNVSAYIEKCMQSLVAQSCKDFEIILVDDCSTDDSIARAKNILDENGLSYIVIQQTDNQGVAQARNTGIDHARCELICFVDSDDYVHPDFLKRMAESLQSTGADIVTCNMERVYLKNEVFDRAELFNPSIFSGLVPSGNVLLELMKGKETAYLWRNMYRRTAFDNIRFPKGIIMEDAVTYPYVLQQVENVYFIKDVLYYYVERKGSIMLSFQPQVREVPLYLMKLQKDFSTAAPELKDAVFQYAHKTFRDLIGMVAFSAPDKQTALSLLQYWKQFVHAQNLAYLRTSKRWNMWTFFLLFRLSPRLIYQLYIKHYLGNQK